MTKWSRLEQRNFLLDALLLMGAVVLVIEVAGNLPRVLEVWHPWDYENYLKMGQDVRLGLNPYGSDRYYPFPTILWIFVPLSLMPDWFRLVWILAPFVFVLLLFKKQGILFFLYPPLWFTVTDAMFDSWLLFPLVWVITKRPLWAGVGAAFLLFKPHVTIFIVAFAFLSWIVNSDKKNLAAFVIVMFVLWVPSFLINPIWLQQMLEVVTLRVNQVSILPLLTTSIWSWWWLGGIGYLVCLMLLAIAGVLFWRAIKINANREAAMQLVGLLINPVILGGNLITAIPFVEGIFQIATTVLVSLLAYGLDTAMSGFGGGYALIPLTALYFQTRSLK